MLKKILLYEYRAIRRQFLVMAILFAAVGVLGSLLGILIEALATSEHFYFFYSLLVMAELAVAAVPLLLLLVSGFLLLYRFYTSTFTDEGYLTFMLPISRATLFGGKVLFGVIGLAVSGGMMLLSYLLLFGIPALLYPEGMWETLAAVLELFLLPQDPQGALVVATLIVALLSLVVQVFSVLLLGYTAIVLGATYFKKQKLLGAILFAALLYVVVQLLSGGIALVVSFLSLSNEYVSPYLMPLLSSSLSLLLFLGLGVGGYFLSYTRIKRHLNLE